MNFSFDFLGFDFIPMENIYGVWLGSFKFYDSTGDADHRSLFCLHSTDNYWRIEILFITFMGD